MMSICIKCAFAIILYIIIKYYNIIYKWCDTNREKKEINDPSHAEAARDMARKSIVLLKNGEIDDVGTHEELLGRNELYQSIYESQLGALPDTEVM